MAHDFVIPGTCNHSAFQHRDDIDGLRAIAVGLVILFHYGVPGFGGGFVGVDIFFVISGFLIGGIIDRELGTGRFSFLGFYERRVRRIFPALFAMLFVSAAAAGALLFPGDLMRFGESAAAAALFWSNIHFLNVAGYWDVAASSKPLLHTWSLAVEEQFYLIFPLILFAMRRWRRERKLVAVAVMLAASFAASVWAVKAAPTAAFYLAPYRFWEFLMGAGLVMWRPAMPSRLAATAMGLAGLAMIAYAGVTLSRGAAFPGAAAILPCLGTTLLIHAGTAQQNVVARLLGRKPVVFIGLISYSLYLWHWPVFVFAQVWLFRAPTGWESAGLAALTFMLSVLSWRYVEQPFRHKRAVPRKPLFTAAAAAMLAVCLFSGAAGETNGLPQRFPPQVAQIVSQETPANRTREHCFGIDPSKVSAERLCSLGVTSAEKASFVLWGDSHAEAIIPAVADIAEKSGRRGLFAGSPSCAPLMGVDRYDAPQCRAFNDRVLATILAHQEITTVILMARWGKNAAGTAYGDEGTGFVPIGDDKGRAAKPSDNAAIFARGLYRTVSTLRAAGRHVLLIGPVPEIGWTVPQVLARLAQEHKDAQVAPPESAFYQREANVLPLFRALAGEDGVSAVFPHDYLCTDGRCAVRKNGIPLYRDEHHLSPYGAKKLEPFLSRAIEPLLDKVS
jgi:peptidoglycan/LPS O-acetylase OafA/YrhL